MILWNNLFKYYERATALQAISVILMMANLIRSKLRHPISLNDNVENAKLFTSKFAYLQI